MSHERRSQGGQRRRGFEAFTRIEGITGMDRRRAYYWRRRRRRISPRVPALETVGNTSRGAVSGLPGVEAGESRLVRQHAAHIQGCGTGAAPTEGGRRGTTVPVDEGGRGPTDRTFAEYGFHGRWGDHHHHHQGRMSDDILHVGSDHFSTVSATSRGDDIA